VSGSAGSCRMVPSRHGWRTTGSRTETSSVTQTQSSEVPAMADLEPAPITTKKVNITPAKAADILGQMVDNRPLSSATVKKYQAEMEAGEWRPYTDPIKFNSKGQLIDGQHRLWA